MDFSDRDDDSAAVKSIRVGIADSYVAGPEDVDRVGSSIQFGFDLRPFHGQELSPNLEQGQRKFEQEVHGANRAADGNVVLLSVYWVLTDDFSSLIDDVHFGQRQCIDALLKKSGLLTGCF